MHNLNVYSHRGALGDIVYSLPAIIAHGGGCLYVTKNNQYQFLNRLLTLQPYLTSVCSGKISNAINLDRFREILSLNPHANIPKVFLDILDVEYDLSKDWLFNVPRKQINQIIINRSSKYHDSVSSFDYGILKDYQDISTFIGLERDYKLFVSQLNFEIPFYQCEDALDMASIIRGSKMFIGNQSLGFALAEAMKQPRLLEEYSGKRNCTPNSSNGHTFISKEIIDFYLSNRIQFKISKDILPKSEILRLIYEKSDLPTVFLPNYGEFGSTVFKLIRLVHFHESPMKIVCCKKGEEHYFPSANEFYYNWSDFVKEEHKWGFFSKRKVNGQFNSNYRSYQNMLEQDTNKIMSDLGNLNYVHLWKFNKDDAFSEVSHLFVPSFKTNIHHKCDVIISPRNLKSRPENNYQNWDIVVEKIKVFGYSVGCVGARGSYRVKGCDYYSWEFENNSDAVIGLLSNCKLYLGLDTGVSHLASIMSVPMIVFSHANQKHYLTHFMKYASKDYFLDLGQNVTDADFITKKCIEFLRKRYG